MIWEGFQVVLTTVPQEKERKKRERDRAFNQLESFIIDTQEKLGNDEVARVSTGG